MWGILGLIIFTFFTVMGLMFTITVGGGFLLARLKSRLPFFKGKGKHILFFDKSGNTRFYYLIPNAEGKIIIKGQEYTFNSTDHNFYDSTNGKGTIHFVDGEPLYIFVQGCPQNVLVRNRDYDLDITKLNDIVIDINKVIAKKDIEYSKQYLIKLAKACFKLTGSYKYNKQARKIVASIINLSKLPFNELTELAKSEEILEAYRVELYKLKRVLETKNHTMINFTDYFSTTDLTKLFNDQFTHAMHIKSILQERFDKGLSPLMKIGGVVILIVIGIMVFMIMNQGTTIDEMQTTINGMNSNLTSIKEILSDQTTTIVDLNVTGNPVPSSNTKNT